MMSSIIARYDSAEVFGDHTLYLIQVISPSQPWQQKLGSFLPNPNLIALSHLSCYAVSLLGSVLTCFGQALHIRRS